MSVIRPPAAEDDDRAADGAKAAAGNASSFADSSGSGSGSGSSSSTAPLPPPTRLETSDAAALVFSLAAAALAARLSPLIALAVLAEGGFYLWQRYRYQLIHAEPVLDAAIEPERMEMLKERLLSLSDIISLDDFLSGWFRGAPRKAILRGNVEDFIAYGFHAQRLEDLSPEGRAGVADFVDRIQVSYKTRFEPGRNPKIEFMAHLWEPLRVVHSPLALRLALESMRLLTVLVLRVAGFRKGTVEIAEGARGGRGSSYDYWVLPAAIVEEGEEAQKKKKKTEKEAAKEEEERAAAAGGALLPLLRNNNNNGNDDVDGTKTPGRSRLGRRLLRRHRSSRSLTPVDSASSLEGELSVDLEGEGERADEEEDDDEEEEASQQQRLLLLRRRRRRRRRRLDGATMTSTTASKNNTSALPSASSDSRDDDDPSTAPILFLHGVGLGITPYLLFVAALRRRFPRRPLLLLEARHVSVGLVPTRAASTCDVASAALEALRRHDWTSAAVVAHSYGTFVAARLLALSPEKVQSLVLLDPVCALTIYPQLLANFVYKPPVALLSKSEKRSAEESRSRSGYFWPRQESEEEEEEEKMGEEAEKEGGGAPSSPSSPSSPFAAAASAASSAAATARALLTAVDSARFLFSRDLTVGEAFCRRFAWHRECLWPQDLRHGGRSTLFGLAGGDDLVPSALVRRALAAAGSRARVSGSEDDPRAGHGGFLLDASWQGRLLDGAEEVIEAGAEEERAEKEKEEEEKRRRLPRVCGGGGGDDDSGKAAAAVAAAVAAAPLSFAKAKDAAAAAACAASKLLLDDAAPDTPARPETADIGEEERRPRRSFSRQRVVPVVL